MLWNKFIVLWLFNYFPMADMWVKLKQQAPINIMCDRLKQNTSQNRDFHVSKEQY